MATQLEIKGLGLTELTADEATSLNGGFGLGDIFGFLNKVPGISQVGRAIGSKVGSFLGSLLGGMFGSTGRTIGRDVGTVLGGDLGGLI